MNLPQTIRFSMAELAVLLGQAAGDRLNIAGKYDIKIATVTKGGTLVGVELTLYESSTAPTEPTEPPGTREPFSEKPLL